MFCQFDQPIELDVRRVAPGPVGTSQRRRRPDWEVHAYGARRAVLCLPSDAQTQPPRRRVAATGNHVVSLIAVAAEFRGEIPTEPFGAHVRVGRRGRDCGRGRGRDRRVYGRDDERCG